MQPSINTKGLIEEIVRSVTLTPFLSPYLSSFYSPVLLHCSINLKWFNFVLEVQLFFHISLYCRNVISLFIVGYIVGLRAGRYGKKNMITLIFSILITVDIYHDI